MDTALERAYRNADPHSWKWDNKGWKKASQDWQDFRATWWGQSQTIDGTLVLDQPLLWFANPPRTILVRKSYVDMFDYVWDQGLTLKGRYGIIIDGQPGTGVYFRMFNTVGYNESS